MGSSIKVNTYPNKAIRSFHLPADGRSLTKKRGVLYSMEFGGKKSLSLRGFTMLNLLTEQFTEIEDISIEPYSITVELYEYDSRDQELWDRVERFIQLISAGSLSERQVLLDRLPDAYSELMKLSVECKKLADSAVEFLNYSTVDEDMFSSLVNIQKDTYVTLSCQVPGLLAYLIHDKSASDHYLYSDAVAKLINTFSGALDLGPSEYLISCPSICPQPLLFNSTAVVAIYKILPTIDNRYGTQGCYLALGLNRDYVELIDGNINDYIDDMYQSPVVNPEPGEPKQTVLFLDKKIVLTEYSKTARTELNRLAKERREKIEITPEAELIN